MKNLAITFLNYKQPALARSMARQLAGEPFPVFCFDNGGWLSVRVPGVTMISRVDNLLFTRGWNWAMSLIASVGGKKFDFVWMLNDDVEGVSQEMAAVLLDNFPDDAAVITPAFNSPHAVFHPQESEARELREVSWVDWTCPMVRMEAWRAVGPFDPQFIGYGADLDWCRRARDQGWKFYVCDWFTVKHLGSTTALATGLQKVQGNLAEMNRLLKAKWGVSDWTEMV